MTILIPLYNQVGYVAEAIDSALGQTSKAPVIVVDDGSTDGGAEFVEKKYGDKVKLIRQVNKGLASARNTGIMNADILEDYVVPLDADDIMLPTYIEQVKEVAEETGADIIAPSFKEFGMSDREVILMPAPHLEDFKTGNRLGYCAAIKLSALLEIGGYSPRMTWGAEDLHLWINLLSRGRKILTIPQVLWMYRTKANSMWTETAKHQEEFLEQIKKDFPQW